MPISAFFSTGTNLVIQTIDIKFEHNRLYIAATRQRQSLADHHYFSVKSCKLSFHGFIYFDWGFVFPGAVSHSFSIKHCPKLASRIVDHC